MRSSMIGRTSCKVRSSDSSIKCAFGVAAAETGAASVCFVFTEVERNDRTRQRFDTNLQALLFVMLPSWAERVAISAFAEAVSFSSAIAFDDASLASWLIFSQSADDTSSRFLIVSRLPSV